MKDEDMTRNELINELVELRQRITELEISETERKRVEAALRESEERYRTLIENANDIIYTHDLEGKFTSINPAATRIYGYTTEEILQLNIAQIVAPDYLPLARQKIREKLEGSPRTEPYELLTYSKEGEPIWVEVSTRLLEREGQPVGVQGIARDITERKRAEEALRESKEFSDRLIASMQDGFSVLDNHGVHIDVNPAFCQMTDFSREELIGVGLPHPYWPPEAYKEIERAFQKTLQGQFGNFELTFMRKNGERFPVIVSPSWIKDERGNAIAYFATVKDITERKRAEEALRESESRLRSVLSSMVDLVFVIDNEGRFIFYHCASLDLLYMPPEKCMGKKHSEVMPLYVDKLFAKAFNKNKKGEVAEYEYWLEIGGETKWYSVKLSPMFLDDEFAGSVAVIRNITERKRAGESLKSAALETLEALSRLVEANDPYTSGHSATVTEIALKIAQEMGLQDGQIDTLCIAGPLHDVGKVGISSSVLNKPTGLTEAEWVMIRAHPQVSANVAQQVTAFQVAVPVIRHHHERWDGTGYPDGLKGDDIPLLARILAVADGFEAMTSERPYRRARTEEEALEELQKGAGTQWDPEVVKVFLKLQKPPTKRKGKGKRKSGK